MLDFELDELAENDPLLLQAEPMRPIRFEYLTLSRDLAIQTDMLERLGLVHVFAGQNLFALNECDSNSVRMTATELLMHDGVTAPTAEQVAERAAGLLRQLVVEQARGVARSALHELSPVVRKVAR